MHKTNPAGRFGSASPAPLWSTDTEPGIDELGDFVRARRAAAPSHPTFVSQVMQRATVCVAEDLSVDEARNLLLESGLAAVPVVNARGFPVGVVSAMDILRELPEYETLEVEPERSRPGGLDPFEEAHADDAEAAECADGFRVMRVLHGAVSSIMLPLACCVRQDAPVQSAAVVMAAERIHHLPVVDEEGRLVGMLGSLDLVGLVAGLPSLAPPGPWPDPRVIPGGEP